MQPPHLNFAVVAVFSFSFSSLRERRLLTVG